MESSEILNEKGFLRYAASNYTNSACVDTKEFYEDLNSFKYIKRLLGRYLSCNDLQERLLLNHVILLGNVFGADAAAKMLWYKTTREHWPVIKPVLVHLKFISDGERADVSADPLVVERLGKM